MNFRTHTKSYKSKKRIDNPKEEWVIFENTHEPIISQHDFDLIQKLRKNKRRVQRCGEVNPFSGMVYCADYGSKMYLCRSKYLNDDQEHLKCSIYAHDKNACSAHYIRTVVLREIVLKGLNRLLVTVKENEDMFVRETMNSSAEKHFSEVKHARRMLAQAEKRISELDKLFTRLYEDNVSGKISDERFAMMSKGYEDEQSKLKQAVNEFTKFIETNEQKHTDVEQFLKIVRNRTEITELTPEIMHDFIEKIVVHAPDKSSGHRKQKIEIHFRFNVAKTEVVADSWEYDKKKKLRRITTQPLI